MKKIDNWEAVKVSNGYSRLPAGGYIVEIKDVKDVPEKEYLCIEFDICQVVHYQPGYLLLFHFVQHVRVFLYIERVLLPDTKQDEFLYL